MSNELFLLFIVASESPFSIAFQQNCILFKKGIRTGSIKIIVQFPISYRNYTLLVVISYNIAIPVARYLHISMYRMFEKPP